MIKPSVTVKIELTAEEVERLFKNKSIAYHFNKVIESGIVKIANREMIEMLKNSYSGIVAQNYFKSKAYEETTDFYIKMRLIEKAANRMLKSETGMSIANALFSEINETNMIELISELPQIHKDKLKDIYTFADLTDLLSGLLSGSM